MKYCMLLLSTVISISCNKKTIATKATHSKENIWVFVMAGQSNMAGRGIVEPEDTIPDKRILSINKRGELIVAKEPLHWYEPERTGLDCGYSFGKTLIKSAPANISVLIIPTAIGGSSISQWLGDSLYRGVRLYSNFLEKISIAKKHGVIKGILWHQGESDSNPGDISQYKQRLGLLFSKFRTAIGNNELPVILGELGSFSDNNQANFDLINQEIHKYVAEDRRSVVISTKDLQHKGDHLHFNSEGQRTMGKRYAEAYLKSF